MLYNFFIKIAILIHLLPQPALIQGQLYTNALEITIIPKNGLPPIKRIIFGGGIDTFGIDPRKHELTGTTGWKMEVHPISAQKILLIGFDGKVVVSGRLKNRKERQWFFRTTTR